MSSPRQLVLTTLKDITRECFREQTRLKMVVRARREIEAREAALRQNLKVLKQRMNRELTANRKLLGVVDDGWEDSEGEQWKDA
jgi:hypothetical protein